MYKRYIELYERYIELYKRYIQLYKRYIELYKRYIELYKRFIELYKRYIGLYKRYIELYKRYIELYQAESLYFFNDLQLLDISLKLMEDFGLAFPEKNNNKAHRNRKNNKKVLEVTVYHILTIFLQYINVHYDLYILLSLENVCAFKHEIYSKVSFVNVISLNA